MCKKGLRIAGFTLVGCYRIVFEAVNESVKIILLLFYNCAGMLRQMETFLR